MLLSLLTILSINTSSACLSKLAPPEGLALDDRENVLSSVILPSLDRQSRQDLGSAVSLVQGLQQERRTLTRDVCRRADELFNATDDFGKLFGIEVDSSRNLQLVEGESYHERHDKVLLWAAINNFGVFDICVKALRVAEISGNLDSAQNLNLLDLFAGQTLLYYNYMFLSVEKEDQLLPFISYLKASLCYFKLVSLAAEGNPNLALPYLSNFRPAEYPQIPAICEVLMNAVQIFLSVADPNTKLYFSVPFDTDITVPDFIRVYLDLKALSWITGDAVTKIFKEKFYLFDEVNEANAKIKRSFYERLSVIKKRMESQFWDLADFDDVIQVARPSSLPARKKKSRHNKNVPKPDTIGPTHNESHSEMPETYGQGLALSPLVNVPDAKSAKQSHLDRKKRAAATKFEKESKRREADATKHARLVAELEHEREDDTDVHLYYSAVSQAASRTFDLNQKNQVCKRKYPASDRFRHSMYPYLTASGTTINFLCNLLVSGTPDYEGFCAAHADLGGFKEEKKNGSKLFYFLEPIKYHKTLHRPHASSDFDHVLYRRFYRNCALHPNYFILG